MRRGMRGLALTVQEGLKRNPHSGDLFIFRGRGADLIKILWHDGIGLSLYAKRLDKSRFVWPATVDGEDGELDLASSRRAALEPCPVSRRDFRNLLLCQAQMGGSG
jgi:transposase